MKDLFFPESVHEAARDLSGLAWMDFLFVLHEVVTNTFKMATGTKEMKTSLKNARECIKNKEYKEALKHCKVNIQLLPYVNSWYFTRSV